MTHEDSAERGGPAPENPPSQPGVEPNATTPIPATPHPEAETAQLPAASSEAPPSEPAATARSHAATPPPEQAATPPERPTAGADSAPAPTGPGPSAPPSRPSRRARLSARWHRSLPLRIATAAVVAVLIAGIGFGAGAAFSGADGPHRAHHEIGANHPFWENHQGWIHRGQHIRHHLHPTAPAPPAN